MYFHKGCTVCPRTPKSTAMSKPLSTCCTAVRQRKPAPQISTLAHKHAHISVLHLRRTTQQRKQPNKTHAKDCCSKREVDGWFSTLLSVKRSGRPILDLLTCQKLFLVSVMFLRMFVTLPDVASEEAPHRFPERFRIFNGTGL